MSVRWTRTATIANGRFMEAAAWAKETAGYVEKKFGTPPCTVWVDSFGPVGTMRWSIDFADLAAIEKAQSLMMIDPSYWQHVDKAFKSGLFIDGSSIDTVCRSI